MVSTPAQKLQTNDVLKLKTYLNSMMAFFLEDNLTMYSVEQTFSSSSLMISLLNVLYSMQFVKINF